MPTGFVSNRRLWLVAGKIKEESRGNLPIALRALSSCSAAYYRDNWSELGLYRKGKGVEREERGWEAEASQLFNYDRR